MTTDFEKDLRHQLYGAADAAPVMVDLDAVLEQGGSQLQRRTQRRLATVATLATVAVAGTGLVLQRARVDDHPAAPVSPAVAVAVASADGSVDGDPERIIMEAHPATDAGATQVVLTPRGGRPRPAVTVHLAAEQQVVRLPAALCRYCVGYLVRGTVDQSILTSRASRTGGGHGRVGWQPAHLAGGDLSLVVQSDAPMGEGRPAPVTDVTGIIWRDGAGQVHSSGRDDVVWRTFPVGGEQVTVYRSRELDHFGVFDHSGSGATWPSLGRDHPVVNYGVGDGASGSSTLAGALPRGARVTQVRWPKGATRPTLVQGAADDGSQVFFVARAVGGGQFATRFTWRAADGTVHQVDPGS